MALLEYAFNENLYISQGEEKISSKLSEEVFLEDMELRLAALNLEKVARQRNLFLIVSGALLIGNLFLSLKIFSLQEKIIMVPGISSEMSITDGKVSRSYLEESSLLFLSALLDLTPDTVAIKRDMVLKYALKSNAEEIQKIRDYFVMAEEEHQKFSMSTYFTPTKLDLNPKSLEVIAQGKLSSSFGRKGYESREASFYLKFELVAGHLRLKEFYELNVKEKKAEERRK